MFGLAADDGDVVIVVVGVVVVVVLFCRGTRLVEGTR